MSMTLPELFYKETRFNLLPNVVFLAYRGSILHGTYIKGVSDNDLIGFATPPATHILGLNNTPPDKWEQFEYQSSEEDGDWDVIVYSIDKVVRLMLKCNPNMMEMLWIPKANILTHTWAYQTLRHNRHLFSSKLAYEAFGKYAIGQLHRMETGGHTRDMGAKRKTIVEQFGYDTKNACSLILLLRQGIEFLNTGDIICDRTNIDADYLTEIKRGVYSLQQIKDMAEELQNDLLLAHESSILPEKPDRDAVDKLLIQIMRETYITTH